MTADDAPFAAASYYLKVAHLRPMTAGDAAVLGAGLVAIDPWRRMRFPAKALSAYLTRNDPAAHRFSIWARHSGSSAPALAGVVSVREPWLRGPYLELLGLLPHAQGQGIGAAVMGWFENEARTKMWAGGGNGTGSGGKTVARARAVVTASLWVLCSDFNTGALAFYKRHGFEEVAPLEGLAGPGFTEILMRKRLDI